jgi:AcrR family transcriptional regulator
MQPAPLTPASPRRGRPRSFDADVITQKALDAFWTHGYEATSVEALVAATGIGVSSVYAAFGSKRGLFDAALQRYEAYMAEAIDGLVNGTKGLGDVVRFVERVREGVVGPGKPSGCLMVNTMVELAPADPDIARSTERYRGRIRESLKTAFDRAADAGVMARRDAEPRARLVQAALFGALVTARAGGTTEADAMLRSLTSEIRRWGR